MPRHTTDDALCRHVADWDGGATYEARQERIQVCLRCPLLDPCRTMTADHVERGIPPIDTVQAAISWGVYGRPSGIGQHPDTCKRGHPLTDDTGTASLPLWDIADGPGVPDRRRHDKEDA